MSVPNFQTPDSSVRRDASGRRKPKVLIVDDEPAIREVLEMILQEWGYEVRLASDGAEAKQLVESYDPEIVISDVVMPQLSGLDLLRCLKAGNPTRPVILVTAHASIDLAVESMKQGAQDFITKPMDYPKLRAILKAAESDIQTRQTTRKLNSQLERGSGFGEFIGTSKVMREVYDLIVSLSSSDASALITGESGTGKELAAGTIHRLSKRADGPFIPVNSAAIPETLIESEVFGHEKGAFTGAVGTRPGCFELANGGTLFLDEIGEMPLQLQPKLLRVLEDGKVRRLGGKQEFDFDVRVIAATNQEPRQAIQDGRLREDLYYRLTVFTVHLPPLRDRKEDIPLLAQHFVAEFNKKHGANVEALREDALEMLMAYSWPGNVREFRNVMERALILSKSEWIEIFHLPPYLRNPGAESSTKIVLPLGITAAEAERELILKTLEKTGHNKAEAARQLGLDVKTIRNKLKTYKIED
jgi:two-component system, NtrC family, response regulator HydG